MDRNELGRRGEDLAAECLKQKGCIILMKNFSCRIGEIDIVARHGSTLIFAEVKTRSGKGYGTPAESVTQYKRRNIIRAAAFYMQKFNIKGMDVRFDVIEISFEHIEDAFRI